MSNKKNKENKIQLTLWNRMFCIVMSIFFLFLATLFLHFSWIDFLSLINMEETIRFSWRVFLACFGMPIVYYFFILTIKICLVGTPSPFSGFFVNLCIFIFALSFVSSFPVSMYVDYKLKNSGYVKCPYRTSLVAPNKYVKDIKLCN
ncbi:DUF1240 domain-containing protein [Xenorhabdus littoralis]|uniref:DUF1240 domain-containing protein n=1 Tax=Xenorhabdus littoralis TaxID=2582835 RepID=UPI0029EE8B98|nr:DUF1240 domain-containing protein [Xenorhabdus sp. psl]